MACTGVDQGIFKTLFYLECKAAGKRELKKFPNTNASGRTATDTHTTVAGREVWEGMETGRSLSCGIVSCGICTNKFTP
jgi:hypothetical protein